MPHNALSSPQTMDWHNPVIYRAGPTLGEFFGAMALSLPALGIITCLSAGVMDPPLLDLPFSPPIIHLLIVLFVIVNFILILRGARIGERMIRVTFYDEGILLEKRNDDRWASWHALGPIIVTKGDTLPTNRSSSSAVNMPVAGACAQIIGKDADAKSIAQGCFYLPVPRTMPITDMIRVANELQARALRLRCRS